MKKVFSILLIVFSAMMLFPCAYADITAGLIYDASGETAYYVDEGLRNKAESLFEEPSEDEVDVLAEQTGPGRIRASG